MIIKAYTGRQTKTVDGVTFTNTHSGQKRAYGDSYYEYEVSSDMPADHVERVCRERVHKAIPIDEWRALPASMENHFKKHYAFKRVGEGRYFYQVTSPYTD